MKLFRQKQISTGAKSQNKYALMALVSLFMITGLAVSLVYNEQPVAAAESCRIQNSDLTEASGLAASIKHPGIVYTHNDEKGPIFAVNASTCKVVGKFTVSNLRSDPDPEAIAIDHTTGKVWFGDIGNGHPDQPFSDKKRELKYPKLAARIAIFSEPSSFSGTVRPQIVDITYQGGNQNSEALLANPKTGQGYIISKGPQSKVFKLPHPIRSGQATDTGVRISGWVTDGTFTNDGKWALIRYRTLNDPAPTNVYVYNAQTWKLAGTITVPKVGQGESITAERSGVSFLIGSETPAGSSPLVRVTLPSQYKPAPAPTPTPTPTEPTLSQASCNYLNLRWESNKCAKATTEKAAGTVIPAGNLCAPGFTQYVFAVGSNFCVK